jgi:2-octaprenyl-6-methoxyphenol hydroxylase
MTDADILIVGGGPVGATLALGLAGSGMKVTVLEARENQQPASDPRAIALSDGSRLILEQLGVWQELECHVTPIRTIHVSQKNWLGRSILRCGEFGRAALGYVVGYTELAAAIDGALAQSGINILRGACVNRLHPGVDACTVEFSRGGEDMTIAAALAIVADGGRSLDSVPGLQREVREYDQSAVVAQVEAELPHDGVAYERFTPDGPVALLPWGERSFALVWTAAPQRAEQLCGLSAANFLTELHAHFGDRVGHFVSVAGRAAFPLKLAWMRPVTAQRMAVIGNAAQTLHPVAGQGFNLGLRDAWELARLIRSTPAAELGGEAMLTRYRSMRRPDTGGGMLFTDLLVRTFSNDIPGIGAVRGLGLAALECCAPARNFLVRKMSLGARG